MIPAEELKEEIKYPSTPPQCRSPHSLSRGKYYLYSRWIAIEPKVKWTKEYFYTLKRITKEAVEFYPELKKACIKND